MMIELREAVWVADISEAFSLWVQSRHQVDPVSQARIPITQFHGMSSFEAEDEVHRSSLESLANTLGPNVIDGNSELETDEGLGRSTGPASGEPKKSG